MKYLFYTLFCFSFCFSQSPKEILKSIGPQPIYFMDSIRIQKSDLSKYDPKIISTVTVYKDTVAKKWFGEEGKDGVIYIETKPFSTNRYQNYFKSKSIEYKKIIESVPNSDDLQYLLNEKILLENYEGNLASINDKIFKEIHILNSKELEKKYNITGKKYGILIISSEPENPIILDDKFK